MPLILGPLPFHYLSLITINDNLKRTIYSFCAHLLSSHSHFSSLLLAFSCQSWHWSCQQFPWFLMIKSSGYLSVFISLFFDIWHRWPVVDIHHLFWWPSIETHFLWGNFQPHGADWGICLSPKCWIPVPSVSFLHHPLLQCRYSTRIWF